MQLPFFWCLSFVPFCWAFWHHHYEHEFNFEKDQYKYYGFTTTFWDHVFRTIWCKPPRRKSNFVGFWNAECANLTEVCQLFLVQFCVVPLPSAGLIIVVFGRFEASACFRSSHECSFYLLRASWCTPRLSRELHYSVLPELFRFVSESHHIISVQFSMSWTEGSTWENFHHKKWLDGLSKQRKPYLANCTLFAPIPSWSDFFFIQTNQLCISGR